jgi:ABC-type transporter MlaC component
MSRPLAVFFLSLLAWPSAAQPSAEAIAAEARSAFAGAVDRVEQVAQDQDASPDEKLALIERELGHWLDMAFLSMAALGPRSEQFSASQLTAFAQEFQRYVLDLYSARIARSRGAPLELGAASYDAKTRVVTVEATGGASIATGTPRARKRALRETRVAYLLRQRDGDWRLVSLEIDDVTVARMFRDEFRAVIEREGPDGLIAELRRQNVRRAEENPFAASSS